MTKKGNRSRCESQRGGKGYPKRTNRLPSGGQLRCKACMPWHARRNPAEPSPTLLTRSVSLGHLYVLVTVARFSRFPFGKMRVVLSPRSPACTLESRKLTWKSGPDGRSAELEQRFAQRPPSFPRPMHHTGLQMRRSRETKAPANGSHQTAHDQRCQSKAATTTRRILRLGRTWTHGRYDEQDANGANQPNGPLAEVQERMREMR